MVTSLRIHPVDEMSMQIPLTVYPTPWYGEHIREAVPADYKPIADALSHDEVERSKYFVGFLPSIAEYALSRTTSSADNQYFTALDKYVPVGLVDVTRPSASNDANIAYWFMNNHSRRKGLATDAVAEAVTRVFKQDPKTARIFAYVHKHNDASRRLIKRAKIAFRAATPAEWENCSARGHKDPSTFDLYVMPRSEWEACHAAHVA